jgi:hypothetical protein
LNLKLVACEILYREFCAAIARSVNRIDVEFLPKGLHDIGQAGMFARLQEGLAQIDETGYEAILFGYGLCSNGLVGLAAGRVPLVIPRAHDCITLFLGDKDRYLSYFRSHPGVYFKTAGWIERGNSLQQFDPAAIQNRSGMMQSYDDLVAKYGEDNAQFLYEELCNMTRNYCQYTFIAMGIEPDDRFERQARAEAAQRGWKFERLQGSMRLVQQLLDGPWDEEHFLVVPPGQRVAPSYDERVIKAEPVPAAAALPAAEGTPCE